MTEGRPPLFLEKQTYRRRRVLDALRFLPIVGVLLWMFPLLLPNDTVPETGPESGAASTAWLMIYIFGVWVFGAAGAFFLAYKLPPIEDGEQSVKGKT